MNAGDLRKLLTIEAPTATRDEYGQDSPTWGKVATVWGGIRTLSGRQLALSQANTITATATHQVTIRYRPGLRPTHRIKYGQAGATFSDMTSDDFSSLTSDRFAALTSATVTPPRYFSINAISDPDERHATLILTVTEVKA